MSGKVDRYNAPIFQQMDELEKERRLQIKPVIGTWLSLHLKTRVRYKSTYFNYDIQKLRFNISVSLIGFLVQKRLR
tara:strand:+ start:1995 stop:2222 length:228 start_codon:yes stop_codon:yes gene_type:complete